MSALFRESPTCDPVPFALPELPYANNALAPYISAETVEHHLGYVEALNELTCS